MSGNNDKTKFLPAQILKYKTSCMRHYVSANHTGHFKRV